MNLSVVVSSFFGAVLGVVAAFVTTLLSERVRARMAGDLWVRQERWKLKRDSYRELLGVLAERVAVYRTVVFLLRENGAGDDEPMTQESADEVNKLLHKSDSLIRKEMEICEVAKLWLRKEAFDVLDRAYAELFSHPTDDGFHERAGDAFGTALALVREEARRDLLLETEK